MGGFKLWDKDRVGLRLGYKEIRFGFSVKEWIIFWGLIEKLGLILFLGICF